MPKLFLLKLLSIPRSFKQAIAISFDAFLCWLAMLLAFVFRLGSLEFLTSDYWLFAEAFYFSCAVFIILSLLFKSYKTIFRHSSWLTIPSSAIVFITYYIAIVILFSVWTFEGIPRTVGLLQPLLLFALVTLSRIFVGHILSNAGMSDSALTIPKRALIYGAGSAGVHLFRSLYMNNDFRVVGFVDDNVSLQGSLVSGRIVYPPERLGDLIPSMSISHVLLAIPSADQGRRNAIIKRLGLYRVIVKSVPNMNDIITDSSSSTQVVDLAIEDLLGRNSVEPIHELLEKNILNETVLVAGAGGSIGGELSRQVFSLQPKRLILLDNSEYALYQISSELKDLSSSNFSLAAKENIVSVLGSIGDKARIETIFRTFKPSIIFHAAAYKHVPIVEHNITEGIRNNVYGTLELAKAASKFEVKKFVLISSDKAVRPKNVMGASKRLAEMVLQAMNATNSTCKFSMVRFGNVLDSSGSVIPIFRKQIENGGPVTLTHEEVTRFFMTIKEAAELVIQASSLSEGGDIFVLDMGPSVKIIDLARKMIALSGLRVKDSSDPSGDIEIKLVGLRPGEKLYEELLLGDNPESTQHPLIVKASENSLHWDELEPMLMSLNSALNENDFSSIIAILSDVVDGFSPKHKIVDWCHQPAN